MFLTSKLIMCFIFQFRNENAINCSFTNWKYIYIYWILDLEVKCTQYGICNQVAFKNARAMFCFRSWAGWTTVFDWVQNFF